MNRPHRGSSHSRALLAIWESNESDATGSGGEATRPPSIDAGPARRASASLEAPPHAGPGGRAWPSRGRRSSPASRRTAWRRVGQDRGSPRPASGSPSRGPPPGRRRRSPSRRPLRREMIAAVVLTVRSVPTGARRRAAGAIETSEGPARRARNRSRRRGRGASGSPSGRGSPADTRTAWPRPVPERGAPGRPRPACARPTWTWACDADRPRSPAPRGCSQDRGDEWADGGSWIAGMSERRTMARSCGRSAGCRRRTPRDGRLGGWQPPRRGRGPWGPHAPNSMVERNSLGRRRPSGRSAG